MPTKSISDAVNLIETVIQSSDRHRSIPKPMLRPRHRLDSRVKVASRLSSTSSDKPRSSTAFILDGRFSEVLAIHFDGTLVRPIRTNRNLDHFSNPFDEIFPRFPSSDMPLRKLFPIRVIYIKTSVRFMAAKAGTRRRRSARRRVASQFLAHRYAVSRRLGVPCKQASKHKLVPCEVHGCARTGLPDPQSR